MLMRLASVKLYVNKGHTQFHTTGPEPQVCSDMHKARRTLELSAKLSVSRHACHRRRIFNMLNNFMHE